MNLRPKHVTLLPREEAEAVAEKLRKCLAEVGYIHGEDGLVETFEEEPGLFSLGWRPNPLAEPLTVIVMWRSRETVQLGEPCCFKHFLEDADCSVERRFVEDCQA